MEQIKSKPIAIEKQVTKQIGFNRFDPTSNSPPSAFMSKLLIRSNGNVEIFVQNMNGVARVNVLIGMDQILH